MKRFTSLMLTLVLAVAAWAQSSFTVSDALGTLTNGQYAWTSEKVTKAEDATKLRLTFLETYDNSKPAGFPYVAIAEFYLYDKNGAAVALTEANFSSNATHSGEGSIAMLCNGATTQLDGQGVNDWYWHSQWSGTPNPYGYHYLEVNLEGLEADLSEFSFGWVTRREQGSPRKIVVATGATTEELTLNTNNCMLPKVSTEIVSVYTIKNARSNKYLTYSADHAKPQQNSSVTNEGYWFFTQGADGKVVMHNVASGMVIGTNFEMAAEGEWYISGSPYTNQGLVISRTADITANNCFDDQGSSTTIGSWSHTAQDNRGTTWFIEEVSVEVAMLSLHGKKIAAIGDAVTEVAEGWYVLSNVGRGSYVSQEADSWKMRAANTDNLAAGNFAEDKAGYLFKITKNGENYNIISGNGKYFQLGRNTASTSATAVNFEIGLIAESADNFYLFDKDHGYVADGQEAGNAFVGWSATVPESAGGNDSYRLLPVEFVDVAEVEIYRATLTEAINNAQALYNGIKDYIGEGLGHYTAPADFEAQFAAIVAYRDAIDENTTAADVEAKVAELEALIAAFQINTPEAGKYYTFSNGGYYITSNVANDRIACSETKDATAIYYFDGQHLLAYSTGLYFGLNANDWTFEAVGSEDISTIEFVAAANGAAGQYNIKSGGRWLHRTDAYINRCSNNTCGELHNWAIEEVTSLPVSITAAGYATFFAPVAVEVEGVTAHTVTVDGNSAILSEALTVIPANTGVVLCGAEGTCNFAITTAADFEGENLMAGTIAKSVVAKNNKECYVLANVDDVVGLYVAKNGDDTTQFLNAGHKAYLAVEGASDIKSYSFRFEGATTGIENVEVENAAVIYDLTGRQVNAVERGIYIINGKKVLVK